MAAFGQQQAGEKLAPYYPTPETIVEKMLDFGQLKAGEKMFDLGSGDGRIVIMAAQKYRANATGVELDADLVVESREKIRRLGLQKTAAYRWRSSEAGLLVGRSPHGVSAAGIQHQSCGPSSTRN